MRRRLSTEDLRNLILNRLTKGLAFSNPTDYDNIRAQLMVQLRSCTHSELFSVYPHHTYDCQR